MNQLVRRLEADGWRVRRGSSWPATRAEERGWDFCFTKGMLCSITPRAGSAAKQVLRQLTSHRA
jgi:hypothetical protein